MLTNLLAWIKQMIYLLIFLTLMLQILPNGNFRKYVKFFAGLIFVLTLLNPLISMMGKGDWMDTLLSEVISEEEQAEKRLDFTEMEQRQTDFYEEKATILMEELSQ